MYDYLFLVEYNELFMRRENKKIQTYSHIFPHTPHPKTTPTKPMHGAIEKLYDVGSNY